MPVYQWRVMVIWPQVAWEGDVRRPTPLRLALGDGQVVPDDGEVRLSFVVRTTSCARSCCDIEGAKAQYVFALVGEIPAFLVMDGLVAKPGALIGFFIGPASTKRANMAMSSWHIGHVGAVLATAAFRRYVILKSWRMST